jgi:hypothetical protein
LDDLLDRTAGIVKSIRLATHQATALFLRQGYRQGIKAGNVSPQIIFKPNRTKVACGRLKRLPERTQGMMAIHQSIRAGLSPRKKGKR